jgi:parallel beta-helix repeat protein
MMDKDSFQRKANPKFSLVIMVILLIQLLSINSFLVIDRADAVIPSDEDKNQGGNGTGDFQGTWYVDSGQDLSRANQTLNLTGSLIINGTGRLVLTNFTLNFNNSYNGEYNLIVRSGGTLELLDNSSITSNLTTARYAIIVEPGGTAILNSSTIEYCGWSEQHPGLKLLFEHNNTAITNSSINFVTFNNTYSGITVFNKTGNLTIRNSIITNSVIGIQVLSASFINISKNNISGNLKNGITLSSSRNITLMNNSVIGNVNIGLDILNSSGIKIFNNNLSNNEYGIYSLNSSLFLKGNYNFNNSKWGVYSAGKPVGIKNDTFMSYKGGLHNNLGRLWQEYYLSVSVKDSATLLPLVNVNVTTRNRYSADVSSVKTNLSGSAPVLNLTSFQVLNDNSTKYFTPHNVTAEKTGYETGYAEPEVNISANIQLTMYLDATPPPPVVDYIQVERAPGGLLTWVGPGNYGIGETETLYCVGYNFTFGYVSEMNASWSVTDTALASVSPSSGNSTILSIKTVLNGGSFILRATYLGLTNETGLLTVLPAEEDYIVITDAPGGIGTWVGPHFLPVNGNEKLYCSVYNITGGYLYDGNATWLTSNPYISSINYSGISTNLSALAEGTTFAEATYTTSDKINLTNETGLITIIEFTIDSIVIRTEPFGKGAWVGPGTYQNIQSVKFYCAGYNISWGYLYDVTASWALLGDDIGWFGTTSDSGIELFITNEGSAYVTAGILGLANSTGLINILSPLPDLSITAGDITFDPPEQPFEEFIPVTIQIKVSNLGGSFATNTAMDVYDITPPDSDTVLVDSITMGAFGLLETKYFNITWKPEGIGTHSLMFFLDEPNMLSEFDESNNFLELTVAVKKYVPDLIKIVIEPEDGAVEAGEVLQFKAIGTFENGTSRTLLPYEFTWSSTGGAKINSTGHFYSLKMGIYNITAATERITNETQVTVNAGPLEIIEVYPNPIKMEVGRTVKFTAYGYDQYFNEIYILPNWWVSGGGNITIEGEFTASQEGQWTIFAEFMGVSGNATVRVQSATLILNRIMVFPWKVVIVKGEEFQFFAVGVDDRGTEHVLTPHWTKTGGGTLSSTGMFNASTAGRWTVTAEQGGISGSATVIVSESSGILHQETFEDPRSNAVVTASFAGSGTVWINKLESVQSLIKPPSWFIVAGAYYDITVTEKLLINWISISLPYNPGAIPQDSAGLEAKLMLYSWSETEREWLPSENSEVDTITRKVTCNVTHLTIFTPMIEKDQGGAEPHDDEGFNFAVLALLIVVIIIIIVVTFWFTARFRPDLAEKIPGAGVFVQTEPKESKPQRPPQIRKIVIVRRQMHVRNRGEVKPEESKVSEDELEE